jgi:hypothetical protein
MLPLVAVVVFLVFFLHLGLEFRVVVLDITQFISGPRLLATKLSAVLYRPKSYAKSGSARPFVRRIVAVGDLHGDLPNARRVLQFSGVVDEHGDWTGNVDFFVQTGDIIDR